MFLLLLASASYAQEPAQEPAPPTSLELRAALDALRHESRRPVNGSTGPKEHLLDALLRLDADVPTDRLVERLEEDTLPETYLLLARAEQPDVAALRLLLDAAPIDSGAHWATACLLAQLDAPDLAARLLERDPPTGPRAWSGTSCRRARTSPLDSATGQRESNPRSLRGPRSIEAHDRLPLRGRLLDHLLGECPERGLIGPPLEHAIVWTTPRAYERALRAYLDGVREALLRVALRLEARGRLEDAHGVLGRTVVLVEIDDARTGENPALPKPPALPWVRYGE